VAESIAWIGAAQADGSWGAGAWGPPDQLSLPLDDRGLLLADGLFETLLLQRGEPQLLELHLQRWREGAARLGMAPPPDRATVVQLAAEAVRRSGIRNGALRLNWSRGSGGRGLEPPRRPPPAASAERPLGRSPGKPIASLPTREQPPNPAAAAGGRFWLQLSAATPLFTPLRVIISPTERRCATSLLSRVKTFAYGASIQARRQAQAAGADDALLASTAGGLCCGTVANLLVHWRGRWLTPPLSSGCLPGVMRRRALELGLVLEAELPIAAAWLRDGSVSAALLLNSLGCRPISHCDGVPLPDPTARAAAAAGGEAGGKTGGDAGGKTGGGEVGDGEAGDGGAGGSGEADGAAGDKAGGGEAGGAAGGDAGGKRGSGRAGDGEAGGRAMAAPAEVLWRSLL